MDIQKILKKFIIDHVDLDRPFLLGLSGGSDSMALFHLLIDLKKKFGWNFGVAHINHNWRIESQAEAKKLEEMSAEAGVPFHILTLDPAKLKGNLELACRLERLKFFNELSQDYSYQAVILGHHQDDQAETVLKRLFEGASILKINGLKKVNEIDGLKILRPFLEVRKSEIENWLKIKNIEFFHDKTNFDPKYMRARFRTSIIPYLNKEFGKDIASPLYRLGNESFQLKEYLDSKLSCYKNKIVKENFGSSLDFSDYTLPFEIKYVIRAFTELEGCSLTYAMVETACSLILSNASKKTMSIGRRNIKIDRKKMVVLSESFNIK